MSNLIQQQQPHVGVSLSTIESESLTWKGSCIALHSLTTDRRSSDGNPRRGQADVMIVIWWLK